LGDKEDAIKHLVTRIATMVSTSTVTNDNGIQVTVVMSKGVWDSLTEIVTDENGQVVTDIPVDTGQDKPAVKGLPWGKVAG
jgi:hypothetical protein